MERFLQGLGPMGLEKWAPEFTRLVSGAERYQKEVDKKGQRYLSLMEALPEAKASQIRLDEDWVTIGTPEDMDPVARLQLEECLKGLCPWRKGPFRLFGIEIDSEWASYLKWNRLEQHIAPLDGRRILDIGSSNGYYMYRMAAHKPEMVLGVEPYLTNYFQFRMVQHYAEHPDLHCLPVRFEDLPELPGYFDTVFSMGILYHKRSPLEALAEMRKFMRRGGELVLETLVIPGDDPVALCPKKRYAKMNNVFFLPTVPCLVQWLERCGYESIRCIDQTLTTPQEQRRTPWVQTETLQDFLDPDDCGRTIEGYPAPLRATLLCRNRG